MHDHEVKALLARQADSLAAGQDFTPTLLAHQADAVAPLLSLAERVHGALKPVQPRPAFVADLRARLMASRSAHQAPAKSARQPVWLLLAVIGGLVSMASAVLLVARLVMGMTRWLGEMLGQRAARVRPAKVRSAV